MNSPKVGIIGRPNVGKSTLFNILARKRRAVVKNQPGVTRDVLSEPTEWWGKSFEVVDTGGITESKDTISSLIRNQLKTVVQNFDLLVCVMDGRQGLLPEDKDILRLAKQTGKPFQIVVNKLDHFESRDLQLSEFYEFGESLIPCSFEKREGVDEVVEWIKEKLPQKEVKTNEGIRISVIGKPNVGKSTFCNKMIGEDKQLVSEIAGTTLDSNELPFEYEGKKYLIVDTAGLRRPARRKEKLERISAVKSEQTLGVSDIVLLMVDVNHGLSHQDARMLEAINDEHKAVILVANKSDIAKEETEAFRKKFREELALKFHFIHDIPLVFISSTSGSGIKNLFKKVDEMWEKMHMKIPTSKLNNFFYETIRLAPAPVYGNTNVKFYYLTQTKQVPPSFIAFANHPDGVTPSYRRFLIKNLQKRFGLEGVPVRIFVMGGKK